MFLMKTIGLFAIEFKCYHYPNYFFLYKGILYYYHYLFDNPYITSADFKYL